ncbi:hypothetical protein B0T25DRAFT_227463 [Lasiosphaeria hispida]|uniref:Uncharacterized protein n=1 Tax=Lasiosphaeria hispida TaxID=260671 RepID=A0AAJ0HDR6_9PEZI|nr:hypothetical protein B0T25DRAFT_227463 [Lasiosphaeria hispida]
MRDETTCPPQPPFSALLCRAPMARHRYAPEKGGRGMAQTRKMKVGGDESPTPVSGSRSATSESASSKVSLSTKRRRQSQGLALASAAVPLLAYFNDPNSRPPPLLQALDNELQDISVDKHFVWPELRDEIVNHPPKDTLFRQLTKQTWYAMQAGSTSMPDDHGGKPTLGPCPSARQLPDLVEAGLTSPMELRRALSTTLPLLSRPTEIDSSTCSRFVPMTQVQGIDGPP